MKAKLKKNSLSASTAKNKFGELLDEAQKHPVKIEKNGRPIAVVISLEEYERLESIEDSWWGEQAKQAAKDGFLSTSESEKFLLEMINAKD